jgi:hypothetical protein
METVPTFDASRYPCIPEPNSSACTYLHQDGFTCKKFGYEYLPVSEVKWQVILNQSIDGAILPHIVSELAPEKKQKTT